MQILQLTFLLIDWERLESVGTRTSQLNAIIVPDTSIAVDLKEDIAEWGSVDTGLFAVDKAR
jgi:hypothetical protein